MYFRIISTYLVPNLASIQLQDIPCDDGSEYNDVWVEVEEGFVRTMETAKANTNEDLDFLVDIPMETPYDEILNKFYIYANFNNIQSVVLRTQDRRYSNTYHIPYEEFITLEGLV